MDIITHARAFVESLQEISRRSRWDWRRCPHCGSTAAVKYGCYVRRPWTLAGRNEVAVQRYRCRTCQRTYSEQAAGLVRRSWYAREVQRCAIDHWVHGRMSLRRTVEFMCAWMGHQERWSFWHPVAEEAETREQCHLGASTLHRWLDRAGQVAQEQIPGQWQSVTQSGQMGVDGLWARLRDGVTRSVLLRVDSATGLVWPPVVTTAEDQAAWGLLFERAQQAGLDLLAMNGITSDGVMGLRTWVQTHLSGVHLQRCVWHLWRNLGTYFAAQQRETREELKGLVRNVLNAFSYGAAEAALAALAEHDHGAELKQRLHQVLDESLMHLLPEHRDLIRVGPEWLWRDFRLRLSHGRNHASEERLERATLVWAIYHNFTPAQMRSEHKRHYKHPGFSPLEVAQMPPGKLSYLDALHI